MHAQAVEDLRKIGADLDREQFPRVHNGGFVQPCGVVVMELGWKRSAGMQDDREDPQPDHGKGPPPGKGRPTDPGRPVKPHRTSSQILDLATCES